ncbi:predicted protein [Histoplasma mississippiense (nom. inval.)]|uniref:predicted protein n=1 Tax=Ajellomyces capsulatus (strain NAm1 / WU24) TaxID=2059318 RepID=UPI000157C5B6|nr:predicted protein [Histoplasma mississippiense (nom. inval.)]EDN08295.1 predicted protein [Histoplasma mississippiense (nom. inval.)]
MDADGAGFSGRFLPFLQSRALPFRTGLFRQWLDSRLTVWYHFVPIDIRLHGLWSTLAYFSGARQVGDSATPWPSPNTNKDSRKNGDGQAKKHGDAKQKPPSRMMMMMMMMMGKKKRNNKNEIPNSSDTIADSNSNTNQKILMEPHTREGEFIAEEGRKWAEKALRKEDMEIYMFRLLLEWARLTDDKRDRLGFQWIAPKQLYRRRE